jgi:hypothetical protein
MYSKFVRYRQRQAGRRYEDYIAQTLRREGWNVIDNGRNGTQDHGIDLIASKDGVRRYVQCKGWNRNKFIHEDVVSHLLGSVAAVEGIDNLQGVELYIYSPAQLDSYASSEAEKLHIQFERVFYPRWHQKERYHFQDRRQRHYDSVSKF